MTHRILTAFASAAIMVAMANCVAAAETDEYQVRFRTTNDDKDDQDVVLIEIYKDGKRITNENGFGEGDKWDNNTDQGPLTIKLNDKVDGAKHKVQVKVLKKNSTDGWQFKMTVHAVADGKEVLVLETTNTKFKDQTQEKTWDIPK
jgi:hypothetical protein